MALRKSKSYNAITISTTRRTVWRESFVDFIDGPERRHDPKREKITGAVLMGEILEVLVGRFTFITSFNGTDYFFPLPLPSLSPRHDDDDVVMWTHLQWAFSHAKLSSLALVVVIGELMRWDWKFFARVWSEEWGRTWNKRFIPKLAKFPATSQFVVSQSFISNSNSRPRVSTIKREFRSAS